MARPVKLTAEQIEATVAEFRTKIAAAKLERGKFEFTKLYEYVQRKATLVISELAWLKMMALVHSYSTEVGWHGLARRSANEDDDIYFVYDIVVPPQQVNGTKVDTDPDEYNDWLDELPDGVFNDLHFQGHSHVSMSTSPSSTDTAEYIDIVNRIKTDSFYVFAILNKKGEKNLQIYDLKKNILFDTADITVQILEGSIGVETMLRESKGLVKEKKYATPVYSGYGYNGAYSGGYGGYNGGYGGYNGGYGGGTQGVGTYTGGNNAAKGADKNAAAGGKGDKKKDAKAAVIKDTISVDIVIDDGKELTQIDCTSWSKEGISISYIMETYGLDDCKFRAMLDLIRIDSRYYNTELQYLPKIVGVSETMEHSISIVIDGSETTPVGGSDYAGIDDDDLDDPYGPFGWE